MSDYVMWRNRKQSDAFILPSHTNEWHIIFFQFAGSQKKEGIKSRERSMDQVGILYTKKGIRRRWLKWWQESFISECVGKHYYFIVYSSLPSFLESTWDSLLLRKRSKVNGTIWTASTLHPYYSLYHSSLSYFAWSYIQPEYGRRRRRWREQ